MKEKKLVPGKRFEEFQNADAWEQRRLGGISDFITKGATPTTYGFNWEDEGIPFFRNDSIKDSRFVFGKYSYISEEANAALIRSEIHCNDILIAITGDIGKVGIVPKSIVKANINQHMAKVRILKDAYPYFVYQYLSIDEMQKKFQKIKTGLSMPQLSLEQIRDTIVKLPSIEEQKKIGVFFKNLDTLITLHQRKLDKTKALKSAYLAEMFPAEGERVPKRRFAGFNESWRPTRISDIFIVTRGNVLAASKVEKEKDSIMQYPVYSSQTLHNGLLGYYSDYLFDTAITWTTDGANAGTVNYREGKFYSTNVNGVLISDKGYANKAVAEALNLVAWRHVSKVGNPKLMNNIMGDIVILLPTSFEELEKMSTFFNQLDDSITNQQQKLDKLKLMKQAYLQEMFV